MRPSYLIVFLSSCFLVSTVLSLCLFPFLLFLMYYLIGLVNFLRKNEYLDFFVKGRFYKFSRHLTFIDLLEFTFLRNPRYLAFIVVYSMVKFARRESYPLNLPRLFIRLLIRIITGYGFVTMDVSKIVTLSIMTSRRLFFLELPSDIICYITNEETSLYAISYKLRMYKVDGEMFLNPVKTPTSTLTPVVETVNSVILTSFSSFRNKEFDHFGVREYTEEGAQIIVQATSTPINGMTGFWVTRLGRHGLNRSFFSVNSFCQPNLIRVDRDRILLKNHGINSLHQLELLYSRILMTRLLETGVRIEDNRGICSVYPDLNFMYNIASVNNILKDSGLSTIHPKVMFNIDKYVNIFESLSPNNRLEVVRLYDISRPQPLNLFGLDLLTESEKMLSESMNVHGYLKESLFSK